MGGSDWEALFQRIQTGKARRVELSRVESSQVVEGIWKDHYDSVVSQNWNINKLMVLTFNKILSKITFY